MDAIRFGRSSPRREDDRLLQGQGRYTDDLQHPGALRAAFVRSPYPSALVRSVDVSAALAHPGVVAVLTASDLAADGVREASANPYKMPRADGGAWVESTRPLLVKDRVRTIGEPVAMVIAESEGAALDAAEQVMVDYEELPAVIDPRSAAAPDAPQLWDDRPGNVAFNWRKGDVAAVDEALARSHHVTRLESRISRVTALPMEMRGALAYTGRDGRPVLHLSHQMPFVVRGELASMFGLEPAGLRVATGDMGGSFGMKIGTQREEYLVFWAAKRLGRAVRWTPQRSEAFLSDDHARDLFVCAELGLDAQGKFTALKVRYDINVGAYMNWRSGAPISNIGGIAGVYTTPLIAGEAVGYFTHTHSTTAYRGAGRPEATYVIERIIDVAAAETGIDPAELRRRNLIPPQAMPYRTPFVFTYDCGEFERNLDRALEMADYQGFAARREEAKRRGALRGIGIAMAIEIAGGPSTDWMKVRAHADGSVTVYSGAVSVGQGLETSFTRLVADGLGLPAERVRYRQGDTDELANGRGNGGSAALVIGGPALMKGVENLIEKARELAAEELEAAAEDIAYEGGTLRVVGTDRIVTLAELARVAEASAGTDPADGFLEGAGTHSSQRGTFPNGCHICEVEIDAATGRVAVVGYHCVEDVGRVLDPVLVDGQVVGGVVQGIGQALAEEIRFSPEGQLITGSLMDYALLRASDLPRIEAVTLETPTEVNSLGAKGVGEAGTVGGLSAAMNAVCHALQPAGIRHLDMPATSARVWEALHEAR
jgi:carbon-monoxide dehydrogenase large subunit